MYESFGAVVTDQSVEFKLFFPDTAKDSTQYTQGGLPRIKRIQVAGDFQDQIGLIAWDLASAPDMTLGAHPNGMLYTFRIAELPDGFYQYKYFVTFENQTTRWCGDPCTKYVGTNNENAAFVIGGNDVVVRPLANRLPFQDLVIYELMIDDFTAGFRGTKAPVDAVRDKIQYLVDLGINAVEFLPWVAWPGGSYNWGYDPFLFFAVENRYIEDPANPLDRLVRLKTLVNALHDRNIQVILDGVFHQTVVDSGPGAGFPYYWLYQDPGDSPFTGVFASGGFGMALDYYNVCVQQFIADVCEFWLDEYQLDGIRFDDALGYYRPGDTTEGIPALISTLKDHLTQTARTNISLMLEDLTNNRYDAINDTNVICATGCWFDQFLYDVPQYAADERVDTKLMRVLDTNRDFVSGKGPVPYIDNHDHSTVVNRVGGRGIWWKTQPPLLALLTAPGAILLRNGQEFGEDYYIPDNGDDREISRPLHWNFVNDSIGLQLLPLYKRMLALRKEAPSLRSGNFYPSNYDEQWTHFNDQGYGVDVARGIAIYHRWGVAADSQPERFIVVLNFSGVDQFVDVPFSVNGTWEDRLNGGTVNVQNFWLRNYQVTSHWGKVFYRKG